MYVVSHTRQAHSRCIYLQFVFQHLIAGGRTQGRGQVWAFNTPCELLQGYQERKPWGVERKLGVLTPGEGVENSSIYHDDEDIGDVESGSSGGVSATRERRISTHLRRATFVELVHHTLECFHLVVQSPLLLVHKRFHVDR